MRTILLFIAGIFSFSQASFAQKSEPKVYDQVFLQSGSELRGEIINIEKNNGTLKFVDIDGDTMLITRYDYKNYKQNALYQDSDTIVDVNPRKADKWGISAGLYMGGYTNIYNRDLTPLCAYAALGRYFSNKTYLGVASEIAIYPFIEDGLEKFFTPKIFVKHFYDKQQSNIALSVIAEAGYTYFQGFLPTPFYKSYNTESKFDQFVEQEADFYSLHVGHGFHFITENSKSVGIEILLGRHLPRARSLEGITTGSTNVLDVDEGNPSYTTYGIRVVLGL